jgi:hypothetical protein
MGSKKPAMVFERPPMAFKWLSIALEGPAKALNKL